MSGTHEVTLILTLAGGLSAALVLGFITQKLHLSPLVGYLLAGWMGVAPTAYAVSGLPGLAAGPLVQVIVLGGLCALLSILFCKTMHTVGRLYAQFLPDPRLRAVVGGCIMVALSLLDGGLADQVYNGAGGNLIEAAVNGNGAGVAPRAADTYRRQYHGSYAELRPRSRRHRPDAGGLYRSGSRWHPAGLQGYC